MKSANKELAAAVVIAAGIAFGVAQASKRPGPTCLPGLCIPRAPGAEIRPDPLQKRLSKDQIRKVYGKIKFVDSFPDYKVKAVDSFEDLRVQIVDHFPDGPGKWQIVDSFPDFKIQMVDSFPDFTVKFVNSFPGTTSATGAVTPVSAR